MVAKQCIEVAWCVEDAMGSYLERVDTFFVVGQLPDDFPGFSSTFLRGTKTDGKENSLSMKKKEDPLFFHKYLARSNK